MCVCVCVCVCVCLCVSACMYVCMYACVRVPVSRVHVLIQYRRICDLREWRWNPTSLNIPSTYLAFMKASMRSLDSAGRRNPAGSLFSRTSTARRFPPHISRPARICHGTAHESERQSTSPSRVCVCVGKTVLVPCGQACVGVWVND